jgi:hypothetical protein
MREGEMWVWHCGVEKAESVVEGVHFRDDQIDFISMRRK